jgi:thioredoxin-like negative regulator of GroEL
MAPNKKNKVHFPKDKKDFKEEMKNNSTSFVKFYSPTCGHCSNMQNAWDGLNANNKLDHVGLFEVDVTQNPTVPDSCNIPQQMGVPYIILIDSEGNKLDEYMGDRSTHDMENFILSNTMPEHHAKPVPHAPRRRAGGRTKKNKRRYRQTTRKTIRRKRTIKRKYL